MEQAESSAAGAKRKATSVPAGRPAKRSSGASKCTNTYDMAQRRQDMFHGVMADTDEAAERGGVDGAGLFARPVNVWSVLCVIGTSVFDEKHVLTAMVTA